MSVIRKQETTSFLDVNSHLPWPDVGLPRCIIKLTSFTHAGFLLFLASDVGFYCAKQREIFPYGVLPLDVGFFPDSIILCLFKANCVSGCSWFGFKLTTCKLTICIACQPIS